MSPWRTVNTEDVYSPARQAVAGLGWSTRVQRRDLEDIVCWRVEARRWCGDSVISQVHALTRDCLDQCADPEALLEQVLSDSCNEVLRAARRYETGGSTKEMAPDE